VNELPPEEESIHLEKPEKLPSATEPERSEVENKDLETDDNENTIEEMEEKKKHDLLIHIHFYIYDITEPLSDTIIKYTDLRDYNRIIEKIKNHSVDTTKTK
jgi:hypothetical protein